MILKITTQRFRNENSLLAFDPCSNISMFEAINKFCLLRIPSEHFQHIFFAKMRLSWDISWPVQNVKTIIIVVK